MQTAEYVFMLMVIFHDNLPHKFCALGITIVTFSNQLCKRADYGGSSELI